MTHPEQTSPTADERAVEVVHGTVCLEDKAALHDAIAKQIRAGEQAAREERDRELRGAVGDAPEHLLRVVNQMRDHDTVKYVCSCDRCMDAGASVMVLLKAAREEEREACAALIESHPRTPCNRNRDGCLAAQIRARAGEEGS